MKHKCPFLDSCDRCTHKMMNLEVNKKLVDCPFNNPNKCKWHNQWEKEIKVNQSGLKWLEEAFKDETQIKSQEVKNGKR